VSLIKTFRVFDWQVVQLEGKFLPRRGRERLAGDCHGNSFLWIEGCPARRPSAHRSIVGGLRQASIQREEILGRLIHQAGE